MALAHVELLVGQLVALDVTLEPLDLRSSRFALLRQTLDLRLEQTLLSGISSLKLLLLHELSLLRSQDVSSSP